MITLIIVLIAIAIVVIFSVQNAAPVAISFISWKLELSLALVVFLSVIIGIVIGGIAASLWRVKRFPKEKTRDESGRLPG